MSTSTTETGFFKPQEKNVDGLPVRLILCFDGTGDTMKGSFSAMRGKISGQKDSIKAIFDMSKSGPVSDSGGQRTFQFVQYFEGIGTKDAGYGDYLDRAVSLFDCATGHGYLDILQNGYKVCCEQLQHGNARRHEIFIFGFSRGAFISRALASFIQYVGLIKEEFLNEDEIFRAKFKELLYQYASITKWSIIGAKKSIKNRDLKLLPFCFQSPRVRLLGAFDTVKTVIPLPVTNYLSHGVSNIDFEMDAPGIVDHFRHALALNEARPLFNPDLWKSEADSADSSYLEAWFFGYHHDIGGGRKVGGLALWPLQWILQAAKDHGLVLDPEVQPYDVLFTGEDNVIQTPHDIAMKMFDMIKHHTATRAWGLSLNMPGSYTSSEPRNYLQYLTMPPYLRILKPKVFLHPSAYLVFDISSSFRLQVYQWKYFRNFLRDRFITLSQDKAPWWEKQTVNGILEGGAREVQRLNLLVIGRPGMGKSELIGKVFGKVQKTKHDIDTPIIIPDNDRVRIYHSSGFGEGGSDDRARIEAFLEQHRNTADVREQIHAMWYFLDCSQKKVPQSEKDFFEMNFGQIPILVLLRNEDKLLNQMKEIFDRDFGSGFDILAELNAAIENVKTQCQRLPARTYVSAQSAMDTPKDLLVETSMNLESEAVLVAHIKAQRIETKPKIALATQESVRAYTIWHSFKFDGKRFNFSRNEKPEGMKMSMMLMEPVLESFNLRFAGDTELIQSLIGTPWNVIDRYTNGLCDDSLPADLILTCMLDTIFIMAYALSHQRCGGTAQPLSESDIKKACERYTRPNENRQAVAHAKIKELLAEDGSPRDSSIANLQMKIIETVELQSGTTEDLLSLAVMKGTTAAMKGTTAVVQSTTAVIGGATAALADATMVIGGATLAVGGAAGSMVGDATGAIVGGATGMIGGAIKNMKGIRRGLFK